MKEVLDIKITKLDKRARIPTYGSEYSAGADLYALAEETIRVGSGETVTVHTGIAVEIPEGYVGLIFARSGLALKRGLAPANKVGVIDSDYRGELMVALYNQSSEERYIENGERVAQISFVPYAAARFSECDGLSETGRGTGGFGSTGVK